MHLFQKSIESWPDWALVYQSIPDFTPIAALAFRRAGLPFTPLSYLTPGTNAVFQSGAYVIKIFAPKESGVDSSRDIHTALFAGERVRHMGIPSAVLVAHGCVQDRYDFYYLITQFLPAQLFTEVAPTLQPTEKQRIGQSLRALTNHMNTPCGNFNGIDVVHGADADQQWSAYPGEFQLERGRYVLANPYGERVFVHGDINGDNLLLGNGGEPYLIDFSDAVLAPVCYEQALIATALFRFDPDFMRGYFGWETPEQVAQICFDGLLIHRFGADVLRELVQPGAMTSLAALRGLLQERCVF